MRTIKNAILVYGGLVNVPVGVATAAKRKDVSFKTIHAACSTPTKERKLCPTCDRLVETDELAKGFESAKMIFPLDLGKLESLSTERTPIIEIRKFVPFDEVNELAVEGSYFLTPPAKLPGYGVLSQAMTLAGVVGIGSQALWGKETPAMVWTNENGALVLSKLFCHDELVPDDEIIPYVSAAVVEEVQKARELITMFTSSLDEEKDLVSRSRDRLDEYLTAVVRGTEFETTEPEPVPQPTVNLMDVLEESIERAQAEREAA